MTESNSTRPALTVDANGEEIGIDPRTLSPEDLEALGHEKQPPLSLMRANCMACCNQQAGEVRKCTVMQCPLWPYRMGTNPFRTQALSPDQKQAKSEQLAQARRQRPLPAT